MRRAIFNMAATDATKDSCRTSNTGQPTFTTVKDISTHPSVRKSKTFYTGHCACADNKAAHVRCILNILQQSQLHFIVLCRRIFQDVRTVMNNLGENCIKEIMTLVAKQLI
jgi:hypothetical protein